MTNHLVVSEAPAGTCLSQHSIARATADCCAMRQGDVYHKIMLDVVESSRNDFEESGVAQSTLDELKEVSRTA